MTMKEHHIGVIVENLEESRMVFEALRYRACSEVVVDSYQHNRILFLKREDTEQKIELIEALDEQSTVKRFKSGLHHICFEVENAEDFREEFKKLKIGKIFTQDITAPAIQNRKVVFACLKNGLFVEFLLGGKKDAENMCRDCKNYQA